MSTFNILGIDVAVTSLDNSVDKIMRLSAAGSAGYVCAANVHMCMESFRDGAFSAIVNGAALVVPDGKPLMWWMRSYGVSEAMQVRGPDLFLAVCDEASRHGVPIALYGASSETLDRLKNALRDRYPELRIAHAISPPFRPLSKDEEKYFIDEIRESGARILFVGLGCPKQERWMSEHYQSLRLVMIGVGAAFDFFSGMKKEAPEWMRKSGLEWLYRLLTEPKRLWKRYLINNPYFVYLYLKALLNKNNQGG